MPRNLTLYTITAALGGFLIGFDIAVLFVAKPLLLEYLQINGVMENLLIFSGVPGFLFSILSIGWFADKYGRRFMLKILGFLFIFSSIGSGFATNVSLFIIFQFINGLAIGGTSVLLPLYISEICPAKYKFRLILIFPFFAVIGILLGFTISLFVNIASINFLRWIFLVEVIPSLLFILFLYFVVRSPRWLVSIGLHGEAYLVLSKLNPELTGKGIDKLLNEIDNSVLENKLPKNA